MSGHTLSWNEMSTAFAEDECLINSRPLGYPSNDPNDPQLLTPNHIILGRATVSVPQSPYRETRDLRKRYEFVQMLVNHFWKSFILEYPPTLMKRAKWRSKTRQLQMGDVVLLVDYSAPLTLPCTVWKSYHNLPPRKATFSLNGKYYEQIDGATMGSPLGPLGPERWVIFEVYYGICKWQLNSVFRYPSETRPQHHLHNIYLPEKDVHRCLYKMGLFRFLQIQNKFNEGDMGVYGIAVLGFYSCGISVIVILTCGIAVSSSFAVCGISSFWLTVFGEI